MFPRFIFTCSLTVSLYFSPSFDLLFYVMPLFYENLFRLIFGTQIHNQIHISYFKSLPIGTYYLKMIHIKSLYLHSKTYNMVLKRNLYLTSLSRRVPVNLSTPTFPNINLTETITTLIFAWKFNQRRMSTCTLNSLKLPLNQIHA